MPTAGEKLVAVSNLEGQNTAGQHLLSVTKQTRLIGILSMNLEQQLEMNINNKLSLKMECTS